MSEHKPEKKAEQIISPAKKAKLGAGKGEIGEEALDKVSGGFNPQPEPPNHGKPKNTYNTYKGR